VIERERARERERGREKEASFFDGKLRRNLDERTELSISLIGLSPEKLETSRRREHFL